MLTLISLVQITLEKLQILKSGFNSNRNIKVEDGSLVRQPYVEIYYKIFILFIKKH